MDAHMVTLCHIIVYSTGLSCHLTSVIAGQKHSGEGMFTKISEQWLEYVDTYQKNYGMAVTDVDGDGRLDVFIAGYNGPNIVLRYDKKAQRFANIAVMGSPYEELMDPRGHAIGVGACDIDGDGREEIYVLNTNDAYAGRSSYGDKLFKWRNGQYVDLFQDKINKNISSRFFAGRSVACVDRYGIGLYGFVVATYTHKASSSGSFSLIEMDAYSKNTDVETGHIVLKDSATEANIDKSTGGRGIVVGPILNTEGKSDIFFVNEGNTYLDNNGHNFLLQNIGNGSYVDVAGHAGLSDEDGAGRGVALADFNQDGLMDIVYGNFDGVNRLYLQGMGDNGKRHFTDVATPELAEKSAVRTVLVADFDNDGHLEIFMNNIDDNTKPQANKLFTVQSYGTAHDPGITTVDAGDATEPDGYGTGGVYLDVDGDGYLELLLSHGESVPQQLEVYRTRKGNMNNYLRVEVRTKFGSPARGALVTLSTRAGKNMMRVIDGGSGYLCEMEPIAHFGLGSDLPSKLVIVWADGHKFTYMPKPQDVNTILLFNHPSFESYQTALKASNMTTNVIYNATSGLHEEL